MSTKLSKDEYGHPALNIPLEAGKDKILMTTREYIHLLNKPENPDSIVNPNWLLTDPTQYTCVEVAPKKYGVVVGHEFNPLVFRGENKIYEDFLSSASRCNSEPQRCIGTIKKREFLRFFQSLPYYKRCREFKILGCNFEFDFEAVSQHYGFISEYIDISKEKDIAKFFAYTYQKGGEYFPITDFTNYTPVLYTGNMAEIYSQYPEQLKLIGLQALMRPFRQKAIAIDVTRRNKVKSLFKKEYLDRDPAEAERIFKLWHGGKLLFQRDYFSKIAREIKENKYLCRDIFNGYCIEHGLEAEELEKEINSVGYILSETGGIPEYDGNRLDKELDINIEIIYRQVSFRLCSPPRVDTGIPDIDLDQVIRQMFLDILRKIISKKQKN